MPYFLSRPGLIPQSIVREVVATSEQIEDHVRAGRLFRAAGPANELFVDVFDLAKLVVYPQFGISANLADLAGMDRQRWYCGVGFCARVVEFTLRYDRSVFVRVMEASAPEDIDCFGDLAYCLRASEEEVKRGNNYCFERICALITVARALGNHQNHKPSNEMN